MELIRLNCLEHKTPQETWRLLKGLCGGSFVRKRTNTDVEAHSILFNKKAKAPLFLSARFPLHKCFYSLLRTRLKNPGNRRRPDGLSLIFLNAYATTLSPILSELFGKCMCDDKIPDCWKAAVIASISRRSFSKFRPIACTSIALQFLEKLIFSHLTFL